MSGSGDGRATAPAADAPAADGPAAEAPAADGPAADGAPAPAAPSAAPAPAPEAPKSRRFPTFTRDTARPEGGGRAAGGSAPAPYRQWPLLAVCGGVLVGLLVVLAEFRSGTIIIGLSLLGGAVLRWAMSSVGMLAVRSRFTDMVTYGVMGGVITLLALMAQPNPVISIPILDDIVHFSVR
ncbi:DUF3017 domain-containing protein [Streptomyces armeniacus]|uniref:DUF3017 domain-containing protein n=1 Tax=Streptomyces armeniacus TaxID=83291 RepID=A0A345XMR1_9ACTN|nr:DUF3017 domain-containing protein [Streptomyces armeniacus]AXK32927.1 DUF3017 domain-containing protein [Streptomyces armeniacus]